MPGKLARSDPRPSVRVTRGAGSGQHLASVLQEGRENANIDAGFGLIWRISTTTFPTRLCAIAGWRTRTSSTSAARNFSNMRWCSTFIADALAPADGAREAQGAAA